MPGVSARPFSIVVAQLTQVIPLIGILAFVVAADSGLSANSKLLGRHESNSFRLLYLVFCYKYIIGNKNYEGCDFSYKFYIVTLSEAKAGAEA